MIARFFKFVEHHGLFLVLALAFLAFALFADAAPATRATFMNLGYVFMALTVFGVGLRWVFRLVGVDLAVLMDKGDNNATGAALLGAAFVLGVAHVVSAAFH